MIATLTTASITSLTPIPLTASANGYSLTIADSQPIIPPGSGGLAVEVDGTEVAQESNQTISVEGTEIAAGGSTGYTITVTCKSPNGTADFASLTVSDLPAGVTATVQLNTAEATSTITFYVATSATAGIYTYTLTAEINNYAGSNGGLVPAVPSYKSLSLDSSTTPQTNDLFNIALSNYSTAVGMSALITATLTVTKATGFTGDVFLGDIGDDLIGFLSYASWPPAPTSTVYANGWSSQPPDSYGIILQVGSGHPSYDGYKLIADIMATIPLLVKISAPVPNPGPVTLLPFLTIGPAWPPAQVITPYEGVSLTTDKYAFSINQGDSIDIGIYAEGFSTFTGIWSFVLAETSPLNENVSPFLGQGLWCEFPSYENSATYTPTPGTPVLITTAKLTTSLVTQPGIYAFTIWENQSHIGPSCTLNVQVMDVGGEQATVPSSLLSGTVTNSLSYSRRAQTGLVATSNQGRQVFRALAMPTQRRTPVQTNSRARHMTITNTQALQSDAFVEAWTLACAQFPGHDLIPTKGTYLSSGMSTFNSMTPKQFQYMVNSAQQNFNRTILSAPFLASTQATTPDHFYSTFYSPWTFGVDVGPDANASRPPLSSGQPRPGAPIMLGLGAEATGNLVVTVSVALSGIPASLPWTLDANSFTTAYQSVAGTSIGGTNATFSPNNETVPGTYTITATFTLSGIQHTVQFPLTIASVTPTPYLPTPYFPQASNLYTNSVYNSSYTCAGFALTYTFLATGSGSFGGFAYGYVPNYWIISATKAGASSVSAKSGSGFVVLGYYTGWPTPAQLLEAWIAAYGDLPSKGTIYFSAQPVDPDSGITGQVLTNRVSFKNGTLEGITLPYTGETPASNFNAWWGPYFKVFALNDGIGAAAGSTYDTTVAYQGQPSLGARDWDYNAPFAGSLACVANIASKSLADITNGVTQTAMPDPPITWTYATTPSVITSGSVVPVPVIFTCHFPTGTPTGTWLFLLKATDGKQTVSRKVKVTCNPTWSIYNGINISPAVPLLTIVPGHSSTINYTITNHGPQALTCQVTSSDLSAGISINFSDTSVGVPAAVGNTPGTATFTATVSVASTVPKSNPAFTIHVSDTYQDVESFGQVTVNTTQQVTLSPQYTALSLAVNGSSTVTYTVKNYYSSPQTMHISGTQTSGSLTTTQSTSTVTVPAASGGNPGSATFSITATWHGNLGDALQGLAGNIYNDLTTVYFTLDCFQA